MKENKPESRIEGDRDGRYNLQQDGQGRPHWAEWEEVVGEPGCYLEEEHDRQREQQMERSWDGSKAGTLRKQQRSRMVRVAWTRR